MELEKAIKAALDGRALLFVGAGFSTGALNLNGDHFPVASAFSESLCVEMGRAPYTDLSQISDMYMSNPKFGIPSLINKLDCAYRVKDLGPCAEDYRTICGLPWIRIYTTNYDNVCEIARSQQGLKGVPKTLSDSTKDHFTETTIVHLNGYIDRLNSVTLHNEFKLSSTSYLAEDFVKSPWLNLFRTELRACQALIFIGVSFRYDIDLQRVIANSDAVKDKIIFIDRPLTPEEDAEILNYHKKMFGVVYNIGFSTFAEKIREVKKTYIPYSQDINFFSFQKAGVHGSEICKCTSQDSRDLLRMGKISRKLIPYSLDDSTYIFMRSKEHDLIDLLKPKCEYDCIVITSELANGKTCLLEHVSYQLQESGTVFFLQDFNETTVDELKSILTLPGNKYIVIENYSFQYEALRLFRDVALRANCVKLVLTARTAIYDTTSYMIPKLTGIPDTLITDFNVDELSDEDIKQLIQLIDYAGIWDEFRNLSEGAKKAKIKRTYNSQLCNVLLDLIKSEQVSSEVIKLYDSISKDDVAVDLLVGICISNLINLDLSLSDLLNILEIRLSQSVKQSPEIRQLVDFQGDSIAMKSPVLCKFLIHQRELPKRAKNVLLKINLNAEACSRSTKIEAIRTALISASNLGLIFPSTEESSRIYLAEYYNTLKTLDFYKNSQFFWLQYAMACMDIKDYSRAHDYLNIAYDIVREHKPGFDTYQIDTQNARYYLEVVLYNGDQEKAYSSFESAHNMLIQVINRGRGQNHLVFKQVLGYRRLYEIFGQNFTNTQRNYMKRCCEDFLNQCNTYLLKGNRSKYQIGIAKETIQSLTQLQQTLIQDIAKSMSNKV